jgi:hypothetical protein
MRSDSVDINGNYILEEELESIEKTLRNDKFHPMVLVIMMENLEIIMEDYKDDDDVQIKINELLDLVEEYANRK